MREATGRARRIAELKDRISVASKIGEFIDEEKLISTLSLNWGVTLRKIKEYLALLIAAEWCVRTPKGILTKDAARAQEVLEINENEKANEKPAVPEDPLASPKEEAKTTQV